MKISPEKLAAEAGATGFRPDVLEKVAHLLGLLDALRSHPFLKEKLVLKGGTALNLFIFDVPRLSVDIDLNYVGAEDRDGMLAERPKVEQAVQAVFAREGFTVRRMPEEHAGLGQAVGSHAARQCGRGPSGVSRIRGAPCKGMPRRSIRGPALHGLRAGVFGSAAGPRGYRPDDFDRRCIPSATHTRPAASRMEGSQCAASQRIVLTTMSRP